MSSRKRKSRRSSSSSVRRISQRSSRSSTSSRRQVTESLINSSDEDDNKENSYTYTQAPSAHQNTQFVDLEKELTHTQQDKFKKLCSSDESLAERAVNSVMRYAITKQWENKPLDFASIKRDVLEPLKGQANLCARAIFAEAQIRLKSGFGFCFVEAKQDVVVPNISTGGKRKKIAAKKKKGKLKSAAASRSDLWFLTNCLRSAWACRRLHGRDPHLLTDPDSRRLQAERGLLLVILSILWIEGGSVEQESLWRALEPIEEDELKKLISSRTHSGARSTIRHPIFGDIRSLVEKTFVQRKFLQRQRDGTNEDGEILYRISVGLRAAAEVGVHEIFEFIKQTQINNSNNASKDLEELDFGEFKSWLTAQNGERGV